MKGRKRKPTHLKLLQGIQIRHPYKLEPQPKGALFAPPGDMSSDAVAHWNYAIANSPRGLLRRLDLRTLSVYANACAAHAIAAARVFKQGITVKRRGMKMEHQNPALRIMNEQAGIMIRAAVELGFTPSSRSRITIKEGDLAEPDNVFDEFSRDA